MTFVLQDSNQLLIFFASSNDAKKPLIKPEVDPDQPDVKNPETTVMDFYNSDLNLKISKDG